METYITFLHLIHFKGEVEQIAMMKCKGDKDGETGMLEYLEDIIGTTRYKVGYVCIHSKLVMTIRTHVS